MNTWKLVSLVRVKARLRGAGVNVGVRVSLRVRGKLEPDSERDVELEHEDWGEHVTKNAVASPEPRRAPSATLGHRTFIFDLDLVQVLTVH